MNACPNMPMQALLTNTTSDYQYYATVVLLMNYWKTINKPKHNICWVSRASTATKSPYVYQDKKPSHYPDHILVQFPC